MAARWLEHYAQDAWFVGLVTGIGALCRVVGLCCFPYDGANDEAWMAADAPGNDDQGNASSHPELGGYNASDTMPSNVSELLTRAQLDNARDVYRLIESRSELNPYQDRELAVKIINKLVNYHDSAVDKLIEEGKAGSVPGWAIDLHRLKLAIDLLEAVDLSDD